MSGTPSHNATGPLQGMSYAAAASSSPPPETFKFPPVMPCKNSVSHSPSAHDRSCNVVLFGLPEGRSLVDSKKIVEVNPFKSRIYFVWVNSFLKLNFPLALILY